jgi:hypothetical protein
MKSLTLLWNHMAEDLAIRCCTSATMDIKTVQGRVEHEGLSFLTITLPTFGKDFNRSLDQGLVTRNSFQGFSWRAGLPVFLQGFLGSIFDSDSGVLLNKPDIEAIFAVRQLTLTFSKLLLPCTPARERKAMNGYSVCDREVKYHDDFVLEPSDYREFRRMGHMIFGGLFSKLDRKIYLEEITPKHGPGATADKRHGNAKYKQRTWTTRLEEVFYSEKFLFSSASHYVEHYDELTFLEPGDEIPVNVISVPKTLKTPRIIAIEPTAMQYAQQAILEAMIEGIESDKFLNSMLGFADQTPNQRMACEGSLLGNLATLDLSDASDRVSWKLVQELVAPWPHLLKALDATRSRRASVPGHGVIPISKYASMGSALCFPMEAITFLVAVFLGLEQKHRTRFSSKRDLIPFTGRVRIYGDDIIVPTDSADSVIDSLERFGARVGLHKSFWTGRFRESCGSEYYEGCDVSYVHVRRIFPRSRKDVPEVISLVSLRNQLYFAGLWGTSRWLDGVIRKVLNHFPDVLPSSSVLGRHSFLGHYDQDWFCEYLHVPLVKGYVVTSRLPINSIEGSDALLKCFLKRGSEPVMDERHLERSGRPRAVNIKPRWVQPY